MHTVALAKLQMDLILLNLYVKFYVLKIIDSIDTNKLALCVCVCGRGNPVENGARLIFHSAHKSAQNKVKTIQIT